MRYLLEIAYKGTHFSGWQKQPNAKTIQEEIEKALHTLLQKPVAITGSGRTDTGVHAEMQIAHFDTEYILDEYFYKHKCNGLLPYDIAIKRMIPVKDDFHARFDAIARKYEYRIVQEKNPFLRNLSYFFPNRVLDLDKMNEAGAVLKAYQDFECFSKVNTDVNTFVCQIYESYWQNRNGVLVYTIKADRFLRGMVRAIVGTMLEIGQGKASIDTLKEIIQSKDRQKAYRAVPAEGLFLHQVEYPLEIFNPDYAT